MRRTNALWLILVPLGITGTLEAQPSDRVLSPKLVWATNVGTGYQAVSHALVVDFAGFAYMGGSQTLRDQANCAFLTKLNQSATDAVWSVCLPFAEVDGLAVDAGGFVYVAALNPSAIATPGGPKSSTVWKLTPDARQVVYSTQISGGYNCKLFLDNSGNLYVGGAAGADFRTTVGAFSAKPSDGGFVIKLDPTGAVVYATRLDVAGVFGVAANSRGEVWTAGWRCNSYCDKLRPGYAATIRALDATGGSLVASTTFGGQADPMSPTPVQSGFEDVAKGVAIDANDAVWVVGGVESSSVPTTPDALVGSRPASQVAGFALKFSPSGDIMYGTYITGQSQSPIESVALDGQGNPYFNVLTPTAATLTALSANGASIIASGSFGSPLASIAVDGNGGLFMSGSPGVGLCPTTAGVYQPYSLAGFLCAARFDLNQIGTSQVFYPLNAASLQPGPLAPGEVVAIYTMNYPFRPNLTFDGIKAVTIVSDTNTILAVVPFGINPDWTTMSLDGVGGYVLPVQPAIPALFTVDGSGAGQVDAANEDGTPNNDFNSAKADTVVSVFLTGAGAMDPPMIEGRIGPAVPPYPTPIQNIHVSVNGVSAPVSFFAQAPGRTSGIVRLDFRIPLTTMPGDAVVQIGAGSDPRVFLWQPRTTIAVR